MKIAVLGYGTVGSGVVEVINKNQKEVCKKAGVGIEVKYILDLRDFPGDPMEQCVVHDFDVILNDPEVKIICETMGGVNPAYEYSKKALLAGKSVCTSNKELVANHGPELIALAKANDCNYLFEASVGGGIPIIRPLNASLTPERIDGITGILNGTTNYMLTKMDEEGMEYADVLAEAQAKGYAEKNPAADVEGYDACRKIAILSSLVYGKTVHYEDIYTEGITKISKQDFLYAKAMKKSIKLLGMSKDIDGSCFAMVAPFMIRAEHPLYCVKDVFNGVCVHGNMLGTTMYYGRGAGKLPTASAVVSDVIDCAKHQGKFIFCFWEDENVKLASKDEMCWKFFVRVKGNEADSNLMAAFGETEIIRVPECADEFAFVTDEISEAEFVKRIADVKNVVSTIRIYE
ncbi:MAG: homoserine dehydrogenase [Lachnospiraceae bacterium]|nr:homoserine dehydrogenase [Lachnospiraceae bacterium]